MEFVLPILALLGLSGLLLGDFGNSSNDEDGGVANDGERNGEGDNRLDAPLDTTFFGLTNENDTEDGTSSNDMIRALQGDDTVTGGAGADRIFLDAGDDVSVDDNAGDDLTRGGAGNDIISDDQGADTLFGDVGADLLSAIDQNNGPDEADRLYGGYGNDVLAADEGDTVTGGAGQDAFRIVFENDGPPTTITDYSAGEEITLELQAAFLDTDIAMVPDENGEDMQINVGSQTAIVLQGVSDPDVVNITLSSAQIADGADDSSDFVTGDDDANAINAGDGRDIVLGGRGADSIDGGDGNDLLFGNGDDDSIYGNFGDDFIDGGLGDDFLRGGAGDDTLRDDTGQDSVRGGSGDDTIDLRDTAPGGADSIAAGSGDDTAFADDGDVVRLGAGLDLLVVSSEDTTDEPVTVRDFDPNDDFLQIEYGDGTGTLSVSANDNATSVSVNGQVVAILTGVSLTAPVSMDVVPLLAQSA